MRHRKAIHVLVDTSNGNVKLLENMTPDEARNMNRVLFAQASPCRWVQDDEPDFDMDDSEVHVQAVGHA